jgi:transposase
MEGQRDERDAVYANRRRKNGERGKALMRRRGELIERSFAHAFETGAMRRTHLRHHDNIAKRLLVHVAGFNLGLLMRTYFGVGKPRCLQGLAGPMLALCAALIVRLGDLLASLCPAGAPPLFGPASRTAVWCQARCSAGAHNGPNPAVTLSTGC